MSKISMDVKLDFKDVLIRPKRSSLRSRSDVHLHRSMTFKSQAQMENMIPIMASNMDTTGTFEMAIALSAHGLLTAIHKHYSINQWEEFAQKHPDVLPFVAVSSGMQSINPSASPPPDQSTNQSINQSTNAELDYLDQVLSRFPSIKLICLDVANGYSEHFVAYVKHVRNRFPHHVIIAGNVVTGDMTEELILSGADVVKVGIGPGSVCTTRKKTGVGYPQLSAVIECADAAHGLGGMVISDGGCTTPGDIAKAFGAGADFVMIGGMLAGHEESGGDLVERDGKKFKEFYGMSSKVAMEKHHGSVAEYRASEGKSVLMPYKGSVNDTILDILGGLRSACTYTGSATLKELPKRTTFIRVTQQTNDIYGTNV